MQKYFGDFLRDSLPISIALDRFSNLAKLRVLRINRNCRQLAFVRSCNC